MWKIATSSATKVGTPRNDRIRIMNNIFIQLAIILTLSSALGFVTYKLKLPLLIAYLIGGLMLSAAATFDVSQSLVLSFLPDIGIAFVLFLIGMELDLRE